MPLQILLAIIPTIPKIAELFTKPKTGIKEGITVGVISPILYDIVSTIESCGLSCVEVDSWAQLVGAIIALTIHLHNKVKQKES